MTDVSPEPPQPTRTLLLVTTDLFLGSRLRAMAEQAGDRVVTVANPARLADAMPGDANQRYVFDLTMTGIDWAAWYEQLNQSQRAQALAYAPHARVDLLKAARAAGIGTVLTRSQLDTAFPAWLAAKT